MPQSCKTAHARSTATLAVVAVLALSSSAFAEGPSPYVMKLGTATVNDHQHEWLKPFAAAVEKDSGDRIKAEIYPASQLGPIPREIEGVQFGSIQGWIGPPEFLAGIDHRYEALSAPGLFASQAQAARTLNDAPVRNLMLGLGADKGLAGVGIYSVGPSSIIVRKPVRHVTEFKGMKIRVLASPFQLEMIKRIGASPVAMTLADVLPALQQGAIDGALGTMPIYTTMHYQDAAKYVVEIGQPWISVIAVLSEKWLDGLPSGLQQIVRDDAATITAQISPFVNDFFAAQRKAWSGAGGETIKLPAAEQAALVARISSIGDDLSKDKPDLNKAIGLVFESAARNK
ncbi:MAG TPA: TRAP transporter substrate-binding protein [Xanthobacteraceae bacterium]|nr:TRAP transporter substrate-binding protein [Xanthobacteraceae bacterium]